jgi:hypothetical protein
MADRHAGFAAAVAISRHALESLAKAIYFAGSFDHRLSGTAPAVLTDYSVTLDDIFLDVPTLELVQANQGKVGLVLRGWGPVTVAPKNSQLPTERHDCELELLVRLTPRAVLVRGRLGIVFDASTATLDGLAIRPFLGSSFSSDAQGYLDSDAFRYLVELAVRTELSRRGALLPPFDASFLGAVATDPNTRATLAVVDDAIVLGLDVASGGVATAGDQTQLTNFLGDRDVGMWTNPVAAPVAFGAVRDGLAATVGAEGATLQSFSLTVEEGGFRVRGSAGRDEGGVTFSLLASPRLDKSGEPARDELRFPLSEVQVDVRPSWWVVLLEVFALPIIAAFVEVMTTMVRSNIINGIQVTPPDGVAPLTTRFTLPGVDEPVFNLRIVAFECHTEGVFAGLNLEADFRGAKALGPDVIAAEEVPSLSMRPLLYHADLGFDALADDPTLRARWTVRVPGSRTSLLVQDRRADDAGGGRILWLSPDTVPLLEAPNFRIFCRLYRVFGSRVDEVLDDAITLAVRDRLDRSRPYVRWTHQALIPVVRREPDGSKTILGEAIKTRKSKIHRTAIPGRCRMASHYSQSWILSTPNKPGPVLEYLADLPFARADLIANRARVCDYCFFGGPTKDVPLIP